MIDDGRYEGEHAYLTLRERGPRTFMRDELAVYCAHCSVNNEMQPVEWGGTMTSVEHPPTRPGDCGLRRRLHGRDVGLAVRFLAIRLGCLAAPAAIRRRRRRNHRPLAPPRALIGSR